MPQAAPLELIFNLERDTKNMVRFQEMHPLKDGEKEPRPKSKSEAVVGKIYVQKKAFKKMGEPDTLNVTLGAP